MMSKLSGKEKIEQEYQESVKRVERMAAQELENIRSKAAQIRAQAQIIGESVEQSLEESSTRKGRKKS